MSITVLQAVILGVLAGLIGSELFPIGYVGMTILGKPLIIATIAGFIVGDVQTGIIIGCTLQAQYLGAVTIGGVSSLPPIGLTAWFAVPLCVVSGLDAEEAAALCVAICMAGSAVETLLRSVNNVLKQFILHAGDTAVNNGNLKAGYWIPWTSNILTFVENFVIVMLFALLGQDVVVALVSALPVWVTGCMSVFTNLLPLLGFMMLLSVMLKNNLQWILFVFGFALVKVAGLDIITVTIISLAIAYLMYLMSSHKSEEIAEEEEF